jgi:tRNA(Ile)-lysidine synthase
MASPAGDEGAPSAPLDQAEFETRLARFAPFEARPHLAVAVSGGADSLALALLADGWARARGGTLTALTVDHRLRPEAAVEAAQVAAWLGARGIAHRTLVRDGPPPSGDIQAAARAARYRLLEGWCGHAQVFHLLTAHHREDQAETLLLRLGRGSGLDGLAGIAAVTELAACRVLRPLLGVARVRLAATLTARGQAWLEDPSNRDPAYARVRLRRLAPLLAEEGLTPERLAETAARLGRARAALEGEVAALLARAVWLDPAGLAWLDPAALAAAPEEIALRALAAVLASVAGTPYPPRLESIERLFGELRRGLERGRTLGGCLVTPRRSLLLICREPASAAPPTMAVAGESLTWDGRFVLRLPPSAPAGLTLGALGPDRLGICVLGCPGAARPTLPALRDRDGVLAVPPLGFFRDAAAKRALDGAILRFRPSRPLAQAGFSWVDRAGHASESTQR